MKGETEMAAYRYEVTAPDGSKGWTPDRETIQDARDWLQENRLPQRSTVQLQTRLADGTWHPATEKHCLRKVNDPKFVHVFAIQDHYCERCTGFRPHSIAITSNSRSFSNASRVKTCEECGRSTPAEIN